MVERETPPSLKRTQLTKEYATRHAERLAELANEISGASWQPEDVLRDELPDRPLPAKWQHSLVLEENGQPFCIAIGAERVGEGDGGFAEDSIHLSVLACDPAYRGRGRGHGRYILREFLAGAVLRGYQYLQGDMAFSLVTDATEDNRSVISLYERHGFTIVESFERNGVSKVVMRATPASVAKALT